MFSPVSTILIDSLMLIACGGILTAPADTEANKAIARRVYEEGLNQNSIYYLP